LVISSAFITGDKSVLLAERSFFGVSRVRNTADGAYHQLVHGSISHGAQSLDPARRREPLTYYTSSGPIGDVFRALRSQRTLARVAAVGLGAGSVACFRQAGESWTFYEIDPVVVRIARDPAYFSFLADCAPDASIVLGDARLSLQQAPDGAYDLLILDAYSADAIPLHLMTREALALYRRKLAAGGVIAMHVSNLYFELVPVVEALARDAGMVSLVRRDAPTLADAQRGKSVSTWMVLAASERDLASLASAGRWTVPSRASSGAPWTDDFSSALSALRVR
jgi:spermidine synthase